MSFYFLIKSRKRASKIEELKSQMELRELELKADTDEMRALQEQAKVDDQIEEDRVTRERNQWKAYLLERDKKYKQDMEGLQKQHKKDVDNLQKQIDEKTEKIEEVESKERECAIKTAVQEERICNLEKALVKANADMYEMELSIDVLRKELKDKGMSSSDIDMVVSRKLEMELRKRDEKK